MTGGARGCTGALRREHHHDSHETHAAIYPGWAGHAGERGGIAERVFEMSERIPLYNIWRRHSDDTLCAFPVTNHPDPEKYTPFQMQQDNKHVVRECADGPYNVVHDDYR
jgi:hypothetical protein